jgi:hypothetical protein
MELPVASWIFYYQFRSVNNVIEIWQTFGILLLLLATIWLTCTRVSFNWPEDTVSVLPYFFLHTIHWVGFHFVSQARSRLRVGNPWDPGPASRRRSRPKGRRSPAARSNSRARRLLVRHTSCYSGGCLWAQYPFVSQHLPPDVTVFYRNLKTS